MFSVVLSLVRGREVGTSRDHGEVKPSEISVISPFREQVWKIRQALRQVGLGEVDVGRLFFGVPTIFCERGAEANLYDR